MIRFDIVTIFPEIFNSYFKESIIARAQKQALIKVAIHNLRDFSKGKRKTVDDRPFGGGIGMVIGVEPIFRAVKSLKAKRRNKKEMIILFTPRGKQFDQKMAYKFSKLDRLILLCGRYEGIDERVAKHIADEEISIGDYVLMGGEIPAMVLVETIARLIPGVIGKPQLLKERVTREKGFIEYAQYTRPEVFTPAKDKKWQVPKVLLSGNHKKIEEWRKKHGKVIEKEKNP